MKSLILCLQIAIFGIKFAKTQLLWFFYMKGTKRVSKKNIFSRKLVEYDRKIFLILFFSSISSTHFNNSAALVYSRFLVEDISLWKSSPLASVFRNNRHSIDFFEVLAKTLSSFHDNEKLFFRCTYGHLGNDLERDIETFHEMIQEMRLFWLL